MFSFISRQSRLKIFLHGFRSVELDFVDRFLTFYMVQKLTSVKMMFEVSCFNKNNCATIRDIKNLLQKVNYAGPIAP